MVGSECISVGSGRTQRSEGGSDSVEGIGRRSKKDKISSGRSRRSKRKKAAKQQLVVVIGSDATLKSFPYNDRYKFYI